MNFHETFANHRALCPDDMVRIETEERPVTELLKQQGYYERPETKRLIALCRKDIVNAHIRLATDRALNRGRREDLWMLVDRRELFVKMVAKDYKAELERIDRELEAELSR
jgi:hypothetical protein